MRALLAVEFCRCSVAASNLSLSGVGSGGGCVDGGGAEPEAICFSRKKICAPTAAAAAKSFLGVEVASGVGRRRRRCASSALCVGKERLLASAAEGCVGSSGGRWGGVAATMAGTADASAGPGYSRY